MSDTSYVQLHFSDSITAPALQPLLLMFDPLGFLDDENGWDCYFSHETWASLGERIQSAIAETDRDADYGIEVIDRQNWNKVWEESIRPIRVSERFMVHPTWNVPQNDEGCILLVIDPKMSFGTGFHETTRLMLRLLESCEVAGTRVLDVGTGTGILAIAAMKLGAGSAVGVDIDDWSRDNAEENLRRNGITGGVQFHLGTLDEADGDFDIILSNITRLDNLELLPRYADRLTRVGRVILSGYHTGDASDMRNALTSVGFSIVEEATENEWAAVLAARNRR